MVEAPPSPIPEEAAPGGPSARIPEMVPEHRPDAGGQREEPSPAVVVGEALQGEPAGETRVETTPIQPEPTPSEAVPSDSPAHSSEGHREPMVVTVLSESSVSPSPRSTLNRPGVFFQEVARGMEEMRRKLEQIRIPAAAMAEGMGPESYILWGMGILGRCKVDMAAYILV